MLDNFNAALGRVKVSEGGEVDNPKDPGGRTNIGVTQRVFASWLRAQGKPSRDVYTITPDEVAEIYKAQYWDKIHGDDLPEGVDYVVFDAGVMSGPSQAIKWLQRAVNVAADGVIGVSTLTAIKEYPDGDYDKLVQGVCDARLNFCRHLKTWKTFGKGWASRIGHVETVGEGMASGSVGSAPVATFFPGSNNKAYIDDAIKVPPIATASAVASGGVVSTAASSIVSTLQPIGAMSPAVSAALTVFTAASGLAVILGGWWLWYAKRMATERAAALDMPLPTGLSSSTPS